MEMQYKDALNQLKKGVLTDKETLAIEKAAAEIAERFN